MRVLRLSSIGFVFLFLSKGLLAESIDTSSWYRDIAISPSGEQVAFTFSGQIWIVKSEGGDAVPLTSETVYSSKPIWSPDGKALAYESDQYGEGDVFVMDMQTHSSLRLTFHGSKDTPFSFSADGKHVLFQSYRIGNGDSDLNNGYFGRSYRLYSVPVKGGREQVVLENSVTSYTVSHVGSQALYTDFPSYTEQEWRKGSQSDAARNIWRYDKNTHVHTRLTTFRGEDRNPVWSADDQWMYFLSERSGSFNVWKQSLKAHKNETVQVTHHGKLPVRFLSISKQDDLAYGFNGNIWLKKRHEKKPHKIDVIIRRSQRNSGVGSVNLGSTITELVASPTAPEVAVVARGEIFIISTLSGEIRRVTNTPQAERNISFSSDGKRLLYGSERVGNWDLFVSHISDQDKSFLTASKIIEQQLTDTPTDETQPLFSYDNERIVYRESRNALKAMVLEDGSKVTLINNQSMYSYDDTDWCYEWSPDGKYIVSRDGSILSANNIVLLDSYGKKKPIMLSHSGFLHRHPKFSSDGQVVYWFSNEDSMVDLEGTAINGDVYAIALNKQTEANLTLSKDQVWWGEQENYSDNKTRVDINNLQERTHRLTSNSMNIMASYLSVDKSKMMIVNQRGERVDFIRLSVLTGEQRVLFTRPKKYIKAMTLSNDGANLLLISEGQLETISLENGDSNSVNFSLDTEYDFAKETQYIFEHTWRLIKTKFYDKRLHGVNWDWYHDIYAKNLVSIHNYTDFAQLLSEFAGELNASHTGARYLGHRRSWELPSSLGIIYDDKYQGKGVRVRSILSGGPSDLPNMPIRSGSIIYSVNGVTVPPNMNIYSMLNGLEGKTTRLSVLTPGNKHPQLIVVKPISLAREAQLSYKRWVTEREILTAKLSNERLGYIHMQNMDHDSYRKLVNKLFGQFRDKDAVVIDLRFNTGGNLHDQMMGVLSGVRHSSVVSRDGYSAGKFPLRRWAKPSIMLANASSYSDGSVVPYFYQREGLGKLVGERVPGTGTYVLWETQQEPFLVFGVPQLGFKTDEGRWFENNEVIPNILVYNSPDDFASDRDHQLEVAIKEMLIELE
ncbi:S41 family peptidase [Vibrio mediterranei]